MSDEKFLIVEYESFFIFPILFVAGIKKKQNVEFRVSVTDANFRSQLKLISMYIFSEGEMTRVNCDISINPVPLFPQVDYPSTPPIW